ncbi:c-type cytochrome [Teredinibacter turnerae]|uniref:c-type cytochrome n=1 Tax=Teredinibacter turnerae TaxID=2426 RepID=UPI00037C8928|nr:cytochrome c [Teredinibacter turnerae]
MKYLIVFPVVAVMFFTVSVIAEKPALNGAEVFNNNCVRCHNARSTDEFTLAEWAVIMPHMREKAHLTGAETNAVMDFFRIVKNGEEQLQPKSNTLLDGEQLFQKYSCQGCHSFKGSGGTVGPALDSVIAEKGKSFFARKMADPQFNNPSSPMPKMPLTGDEIEALAEFLSTVPGEVLREHK